MDIEATVKQITGPCSCHDSYTPRRMVDDGCTFHELSSDIVDALRKAQDEAYERAAELADQGVLEGDDGGRTYCTENDCIAIAIRKLKSMVAK